jgi:hypothetical protein
VDLLLVYTLQVKPELHVFKSPRSQKLQDPPIQVLEAAALLVKKLFHLKGEKVRYKKFSAYRGI